MPGSNVSLGREFWHGWVVPACWLPRWIMIIMIICTNTNANTAQTDANIHLYLYPSHGYTDLIEDEICKKYQACWHAACPNAQLNNAVY